MPTTSTDNQLVTIVLVVLGALLILPVLFMGFGMMGFGPMMGGMWGGHMWGDGTVPGWMVLVGLLMQLLFIAAIVGAGYLIYRAVATSNSGTDQALEELRLAYARGDLTDDEYEQRKEALERDS
ncbi:MULTISPECIES: SHOCT domain-containing protein [Haloarculaceae]|jgi:putative membrane protein|uniref:SHOCT domain-containing protein n=1 Tax=Halosegnis longus TaxID=2216012 RepID=A0AAJ4UUW4_9EURY|nr:SHOCT domain-containing protein [Halomicroarcula laminariae]RNJ22698.1 SHOCT domain-containing protein [Salella cibi]